uniref:Uncharacterized protein n=1 Tax=Strigamia maritima TaxID=126957 RepID=T1IZA7_STRMM
MLEKLNENKEAKLTSDLIELIGKMSATPETPSIPASALQALISIQAATATPSPSVPIGVLQALVGHSDSSSNILRLLNPPAQTVSPELLRMLLNLYSPTTPPPGIPLHVVEALVGIQQRTTTSNVNLDVLKLLSGSNSNLPLDVVLSLIKPTNVNNNAVSVDLVKALVKAMSDKDKPTDKETLPVATEPDVVRRTTKNKKNNALKGKESENENESKTKDAVSETLLDEDLIDLSLSDVETTTKKEKRVSSNGKNLTRNFPERGGPPLPAIPGTSVIANFGPHGIHWKVLDKPGSHLRSPNPFIFSGSPQFGDRPPHIFNDRPLYQFHPPLRPLFQTNLPNYKVTIHQPINLHNPLRHPVKSVGRFPKNINIHVPIPAPRPYMQKPPIMYPSSTPCPEPSNYNYQPKPNHQQSQLLFPALRPPTLPGNTHLPFKPEVPSVHPLLPQRPSFPRPTVPDFENSFGNSFGPSFEPPIFIDDIDSIDDFLKKKKNNNSHNIPKDLFSSVKGSQETNFSSEINILEESGKNPSINSQVSLDSFEEQTRVNSRRVTTTEKPEIDSVDDIIDALRLEEDIATTTADPFEELMTAFEKINKDKDAVENFLKRANLSTSLTTIAPTLRIDNTEPRISTVEPHKYNLQQIFNLPPTAGLGWNGESINQAKLEQILDKQKPDRQVVIIENSPLIVVPPETATWPNRNVVHKRETTPPPDDDYDEFFGTTPISRPGNKPLPITISKPSEGLVKSGGKRKLMPGEVEIEIPGELFAQVSAGDDKKRL